MKIIGITGGIGSGKTTVSKYISSLGFDVIDADSIARDLAGDSGVLGEIRDYFGDDVITEEGILDRKRMADLVFSDISKREMLESIITSRVIQEVEDRIEDFRSGLKEPKRPEAVFLDAPTLFETGADRLVDEIWLVTCDFDKRVERIRMRDGSASTSVEARVASQMPEDEKAERSDVVIMNNGRIEELYAEIDRLIAGL